MAAYDITAPNTGTSLETMDAASLRELWAAKVAVMEQEEDFFSEFEGQRTDSVIETVTDTSKGAGHRITFSSMAGFYQEGKHGEEVFEEATDYEKVKIASNQLLVDYIRHGTRWSERMEDHMGLKKELSMKFPEEIGKWIGRKKDRAAWMKFKHAGSSRNYAVAGGGSDVDALGASNGLTWNDIVEVTALLKNHGAAPAYLGKVKNNPVKRFIIAASTNALLSLKNDDQYIAALQESGIDGTANELFTGGYADVDGQIIREKQIIDHDGDGPLGSPIAPKLRLSAAIASPTASFAVTGGTNTKVLYTCDFPNHAFRFNAVDALTAGTTPFYILVVNPPNAPTDPGKMGMYKCVGNTGKAITVTEALSGATATGFLKNTLGAVTWNTGVWVGKHTTVHPAGAMAYLVNAKGQPIGDTPFLGGCAMRRGYGQYRNSRATDQKEGGFIQETYGVTVFGQAPKMNADHEFPNFMVLKHSIIIPGSPIPRNIT